MSYTASIDVDHSYQVASNKGYYDLCDWIDELDWKEYEGLAILRNYGWHPRASVVSAELKRAIESDPPASTVRKTAESLIGFIGSNDPDGVLTIS